MPGDLIWPKVPGQKIFYNEGKDIGTDEDREDWEKDRAHFLSTLVTSNERHPADIIREIREMTYDAFLEIFGTAKRISAEMRRKATEVLPLKSGHIAIIDYDSASKQHIIIEALKGVGVVTMPYAVWIQRRSKQIVWHGRVKHRLPEARAQIAVEARKHVGKPYELWSWLLDDERHFYCSKLVWLSTMKTLSVSLDEIKSPFRFPWISPAQILYGGFVDVLYDPGNYFVR